MIQFRNISTSSSEDGLQNVSFDVKQKDIHLVTALDTSTINSIWDLFRKSKPVFSGDILIDNIDYRMVQEIEWSSAYEGRGVEELTVAQYVIALRRNKAMIYSARKAEQACNSYITQYGFSFQSHQYINSLNIEEQRCVELLRIRMSPPKVLVLYELYNVLSFQTILSVNKLLADLRLNGTHIIYLTRKFDDIFRIGDTVTVLRDGIYIDTLQKKEIVDDPRHFYSIFLGERQLRTSNTISGMDDSADILEILRIGNHAITSEENLPSAVEEYIQLIERYFPRSICVIYLLGHDNHPFFLPVFNLQRNRNQIPLFEENNVHQMFTLSEEVEVMKLDNSFPSGLAKDTYRTLLNIHINDNGTTVGIIQVFFPVPYSAQKDDLTLLFTIRSEILQLIRNANLAEHSYIMQESHHRIKNNLQLIVSMLTLQKNSFLSREDSEISIAEMTDVIDNVVGRIQSIASVHDLISHSKVLSQYISVRAVLAEISRLYRDDIPINIDVQGESPLPHSAATAFAVILNELISNTLKHNSHDNLLIFITVKVEKEEIQIDYSDNGRGFPETGMHPGIGLMLIQMIVEKELKGELIYYNDCGAHTKINITKKEIYKK